MLATVWLDIVFLPLLLLGVETIKDAPGTNGGYGNNIIHAEYTHSFVGAIVLAIVLGAVAAHWWGQRAGVVLAAVAFSHWLLDLIVHRADMPILPGNLGDLPLLGLGLWRVPIASAIVELALILIGAYLYWQAAEQIARSGGRAAEQQARFVAGLLVVAGIITLAVDVLIG
jgi:membrane-bound metal-dependent hydrolase YbcI (DUF457 family)